MSGINKPIFKLNLKANIESTTRKTVFYDLKPDTATRLRVVPPVDESGMIFTKSVNHFKLKNDEGFGIALACLEEHGTDETGENCFLCRLTKHLFSTNDKGDAKIAKEISASSRWYLQAYIAQKQEDGTLEYLGPKLVGLSKTTAERISGLLATQDTVGDDYFCDVENGQDLVITRQGSGFKTKYTVDLAGKKVNLNEIVPDWNEEDGKRRLITDVYDALNLKAVTPQEQSEAVLRTFGDEIDWEAVEAYLE